MKIAGVSPELEAIIDGAVRGLSRDDRVPPYPDSLQANRDWRRIAEISRQHRVAPLVYRGCFARAVALPADAEPLRDAYVANSARNALLFRSLADVLKDLAAAGIPVLVLKGAFVADLIYPERALRPMNDVDLMVREEDLEGARGTLQSLGYDASVGEEGQKKLRKNHHHWVFHPRNCGGSGIPVELHWNLHPPSWPFHVELKGLWRRASAIRVAGVEALGLGPEDLLLYACTHASRHRFNGGLISLCDIAATVAHYGDRIAWSQFQARAAEWNADSDAFVTLALAAELLAVPVPPSTLAAIRRYEEDDSLLELARERILEEKGPVRAAADLRLRCIRRGSRATFEALRKK